MEGLQSGRKVASAYDKKHNKKNNTMMMAMGIACGMMIICLIYQIHTRRQRAEMKAHHAQTQDILRRHRLNEHVSDEEHAEMLAKHGMHETDEDLRMHALEFFDHDQNKDAFHAGPDATKAEIESMDKNNDQAVSWNEYLNGFHNEKLIAELFHHYYGEIYGKGIPNHYHSERHPDAVVDHHIVHENDEELTKDHPDYKEPHEIAGIHYDIPTAAERELQEHIDKLDKPEKREDSRNPNKKKKKRKN